MKQETIIWKWKQINIEASGKNCEFCQLNLELTNFSWEHIWLKKIADATGKDDGLKLIY